ncbi:uncharacterized protein LOC100255010 isoform X4 [Vitis vinifera]|uniref:uncharacterized protein LOC100255010 isoform X4 n=1 Tax=Vitis vinifera TaxID=29760 RepID=UPI00053FC9A4|nr:uncharacterized protein LOC100255010 isoform X4 [Vitis vinifera]|eukprot:XP_010649515.1 PREDICTED: uncharacterized protein LOC100255010 isoform X4 [Vitis vinifera]
MSAKNQKPHKNPHSSFNFFPPRTNLSKRGTGLSLYVVPASRCEKVDCIDCAADASVVSAVNEGIEAAREIVPLRRPWVMISVNDNEDLHFRKAEFDPADCPPDCSRPCEVVCPANAISLVEGKSTVELPHSTRSPGALKGGVITERCYGCGRCFPVCPFDKISVVTYVRNATATTELLKRDNVDAVEIHTSGRVLSLENFGIIWEMQLGI